MHYAGAVHIKQDPKEIYQYKSYPFDMWKKCPIDIRYGVFTIDFESLYVNN